jgi:hypothetical protein
MWLVAVAIMVGIVVLASKAPAANPSTGDVGPNSQIPATGTSGVPSPATTNGSPLGTAAGQVILNTNYALPAAPFAGSSPPSIPPKAVVDPSVTRVPITSANLLTQAPVTSVKSVPWGAMLAPGTFKKI